MASGGKYLENAYIDPHHKINQILLKFVVHSELGDCIVYADIGKADSLLAAGVPKATPSSEAAPSSFPRNPTCQAARRPPWKRYALTEGLLAYYYLSNICPYR